MGPYIWASQDGQMLEGRVSGKLRLLVKKQQIKQSAPKAVGSQCPAEQTAFL